MTAEIAILNKHAVALAADSAELNHSFFANYREETRLPQEESDKEEKRK